jgi:hypothetical protein
MQHPAATRESCAASFSRSPSMKEFLVTYLEPAEAIDDAIEIMEIHALGGM